MKYNQKIIDYVRSYNLDEIVPFSESRAEESLYFAVENKKEEPYPPEWEKLVFVHKVCLERKVMTTLEVGVGYSSIISAHALHYNKVKHGESFLRQIRRDKPYTHFSVDDNKHFIEKCMEKMPEKLKEFIDISYSENKMGVFNDRVCTYFERFPNVCPDLIILDGPSQFSVTGDVRGIHTRSRDRLPMSADLLAIENFLLPGTLIIVIGQTANLRFLLNNFQRTWGATYFEEEGICTLELIEKPLGKYNAKQIELMLGSSWPKV